MKAHVNRIIEFSNVDGPGNRMAIFFQKCPFKCLYCHNPETINHCINCGECVKTCPVGALEMIEGKVIWHKDKCVNCDTCIHTCKNLASPKIDMFSVDDILERIIYEKDFIQGITVSGGECMESAEFITELFKEVKKLGLTCFTDSNGFYLFEDYPELLKYMDYCMLDVKAYDNDFHKVLCGRDNTNVLRNLKYLQDINKLYEVRTVILKGHKEENEKTVREVVKHLNPDIRYKLIKYRPFGVRDEGLDILGHSITDDEEIERLKKIATDLGHHNIIIV